MYAFYISSTFHSAIANFVFAKRIFITFTKNILAPPFGKFE